MKTRVCIRGMTQFQAYLELTKDDMGKCYGCTNLIYSNGVITCPCFEEEDICNEN